MALNEHKAGRHFPINVPILSTIRSEKARNSHKYSLWENEGLLPWLKWIYFMLWFLALLKGNLSIWIFELKNDPCQNLLEVYNLWFSRTISAEQEILEQFISMPHQQFIALWNIATRILPNWWCAASWFVQWTPAWNHIPMSFHMDQRMRKWDIDIFLLWKSKE
jgi:hypothetical protein